MVRTHTFLGFSQFLSVGYDTFLDFIKELPVTQHPEAFGMHENVDISKELQVCFFPINSVGGKSYGRKDLGMEV